MHLEHDELYTRVGENLPPQRVPGLDNDLHRAQQSLLGECNGRTKR